MMTKISYHNTCPHKNTRYKVIFILAEGKTGFYTQQNMENFMPNDLIISNISKGTRYKAKNIKIFPEMYIVTILLK